MFVIVLTYIKPLAEVDYFIEEHRRYLEKYYATGHFLLSGRRQPRNGGVIVADGKNKEEIENILQEDPFSRERIAKCDIIDFQPSMAAVELSSFIVNQ